MLFKEYTHMWMNKPPITCFYMTMYQKYSLEYTGFPLGGLLYAVSISYREGQYYIDLLWPSLWQDFVLWAANSALCCSLYWVKLFLSLTHWLLSDFANISKVWFSNSFTDWYTEHTCVLALSGPFHHDDVTKWKHFPRYWPFVRGPRWIPHTKWRQWRGALVFSLICNRINGWISNRAAGDLRRPAPIMTSL